MFPLVHEALVGVLPVERLRWISFSHVEADECGSLNEWLKVAPAAVPLCGRVAALVSIEDLADRSPRAMADGETQKPTSLRGNLKTLPWQNPLDH